LTISNKLFLYIVIRPAGSSYPENKSGTVTLTLYINMINPYQKLFEELQPRADRNKLESPLEELFIYTLEKYISAKSEIFPQYEVMTLAGKFRLDFLLTVGDKKIAFECDGKEFHNEWYDEWRDALILGSGEIDTIYRFRGKDLHAFLDDCIYLIFHYDKELFNDRYPIIAQQLISDELKNQLLDFYKRENNIIGYAAISKDGKQVGLLQLVMERRNKLDKKGHWNILFNIAKKNPGLRIEQLIEIRKKEMDAEL